MYNAIPASSKDLKSEVDGPGQLAIRKEIDYWHRLSSETFGMDVSGAVQIVSVSQGEDISAQYDSISDSISVFVPIGVTDTSQIPDTLLHENAHRKRADFFRIRGITDQYDLFSPFFDEGLAMNAECDLLGQQPNEIFSESEQQDGRYIDGLLADLLFYINLEHASDSRINRYLFGQNFRTASRCYRVGHYIVAKAAILNNLSVEESLNMPDAFYREFAEEIL